MVLAPTLTLHTPAGSRLDADAAAFAAASGATDVAALSEFVKGVKALGLWNSMVCWPLRSSQNAGTGTTAYSLGGLGTFNGTLTNGPSWGADGITFDGANDHIACGTLSEIISLGAFFSASSAVTSASAGQTLCGYRSFSGLIVGNVSGSLINELTTSLISSADVAGPDTDVMAHADAAKSLSGYTGVHHSHSSGGEIVLNGAGVTATNVGTRRAFAAGPWRIGLRGFGDLAFNGTASLVYMVSTATTATEGQSIYTLYKTTLGTGLGLP